MMKNNNLLLLIALNVFHMGYTCMQTFKEPTWNTSINIKSNTEIGVVIFTVPDHDRNGKIQTDIHLCNTSEYFEIIRRNQWEIRVKSCLPDDYIEVLHLCLENDCTCHGILKITAIHFWYRGFRPMDVVVMVTDRSKEDGVIDITTSNSFGGCTRLQPGCSIVRTNNNRLFWFSSGNHQVFSNTRGINYGLPYPLKVTCQERSDPKLFSLLHYKSFYVRLRFIPKLISNAAQEDEARTTHLQPAVAIPDSEFKQFRNRSANIIFRLTSMGSNTSTGLHLKKLKRRNIQCGVGGGCGGGGGRGVHKSNSTVAVSAKTAQMFTVTSLNTTTASTKAASTLSMSRVTTPTTKSTLTMTTSTSSTSSVTVSITSTPKVQTTTGTSTAATLSTKTVVASLGTTIISSNAEHVNSSAFFDDPVYIALISTLAGFIAIGSIVGIISYIRIKIARTDNNRFNSTVHESASTSSGNSTISSDKDRYSVSTLSPNIMISNKASLSLTPVETV